MRTRDHDQPTAQEISALRAEMRREGLLDETPKKCDKFGNPVGTKYDAYDNPISGDGEENI